MGHSREFRNWKLCFCHNIKSIFWYYIKVHIHIKCHSKWICTFETRFSVSKFPARSVFYYSFYQRSISNGRPDEKQCAIQKFAGGKWRKLCTFFNDTTIRLSECNKSNHPKACKLPSDHQSGWAAHVWSEDHLISFLDSSGKTQSLWIKNSNSNV